MTEPTPQIPRNRRIGLFVLVSVALLALAGAGGLLVVAGGQLQLPGAITQRIEARVNAGLAAGRVELGALRIAVEDGFTPVLRVSDLVLSGADARQRAALPDLEARLDRGALLRGALRPERIRLAGARIRLRRTADGTVDVAFGGAGTPEMAEARGLEQTVRAVERLFDGDYLRRLEVVEGTGLAITFDDALTGRVWEVADGRLTLENGPEILSADLGFRVDRPGAEDTVALLAMDHAKGTPGLSLRVRFNDVPARDIAVQSVALSWLDVLDAPISGALAMEVTETGQFEALNGTLEIGAGALDVIAGQAPTEFRRAKTYFTYDDAASRLTFDQVVVESDAGTVEASGHAYLRGRDGRMAETLLGQLRFTTVELNPRGIFEAPAVFTGGAIDMRVRLDPFRVDLGQLVLTETERRYRARGSIAATPDGWESRLDFSIPALDRDRMLALWPVAFKPGTRRWMSENIRAAELRNITGAFRRTGTAPARFSLNYDFQGLDGRFMRTMPPLEQGNGFGVLTHQSLDMKLYSGTVTPSRGGPIALDGSVFSVPDITVRDAPAEIRLQAAGNLRAALEILDSEPFRFLTKARLPTDFATGQAEVAVEIGLPLKDDLKPDDVRYGAEGTVTGVAAAGLMGDRVLRAPRLRLRTDADGLTVSGAGSLGAVPVEGAWIKAFGPEHRGRSRLEATVELSQAFVEEFGIGLPEGAVGGTGLGTVEVALGPDAPPSFRLVSDLNRLRLSLPALGWGKGAATTGRLEVAGSLGQPAAIDTLEIEAAGLSARGAVALAPDGGLDAARFDRVRIGGWFDGPVVLRGRGAGVPAALSVEGGTLDMRRARFGPGGGAGGPISVSLDRLVVTDGIALTGVRGALETGGALNGRLAGQVNAAAPVTATLAPMRDRAGTGIRITGADAGAILRAAGIFPGAAGGSFALRLVPTGTPRSYDGTLQIRDTRVRDAPTLAELISAVSVVGLLEQLSGEGLYFSDVDAQLSLTPGAVTVRKGSAIGPSIGLSMEGVYDTTQERLAMQGVFTPVYMLNGMLEQTRLFGGIFGRDRGEGVFGFNYELRGPTDAPEVTVNPLSGLAPGFLRELFRRPPPTVAGQ